MHSLFRYQKVTDQIIRINGLAGLTNEFFYLVIGEKKAALIDTGFGLGDLASFVRTFTDLPVIVLCTHGHLDHVGGNGQFEEVYICPEDRIMAQVSYSPAAMNAMAQAVLKENGLWMDPAEGFAPPAFEGELKPIYDGDLFDLGGITLEAITMPGHSAGCVSFLWKEGRILFSGDNCGPQPLIMLQNPDGTYSSCTLEVYAASLRKLLERENEFDRILNCHKKGELPFSCVHGVLEAAEGVLSGKYPGIPTAIHKGKVTGVFSAKGLDPENIMGDPNGFSGDIIFAKDNIR